MDKKEKEMRLKNHENYWDLVDKIREMSLDALDDLSPDDIISVLDRVKVVLIQQQVILEIEDSQKQSESETEDDSEDGDEEPVIPLSVGVKSEMPFVNPMELMEEAKRGMLNN